MKIDLADVISSEGMELSARAEIGLRAFESRLGKLPITEKPPFDLSVRNEGGGRLSIRGEASVTVAIPCARCLEEVARTFRLSIDEEVKLSGAEAGGDPDGWLDVEGTSLDVDQLIHEEILVRWPSRVLCKEDCKGICKRCGANLNVASCRCQPEGTDPRMAAIRDIFKEFKEV